MAVSEIKINTQMLQNDTQSVESCLSDIERTLNNMGTDVVRMNTMWDGDANAAFNKRFIDDIQRLIRLCAGIADIVDYEKTAVKEYTACEKKVDSLVDEVLI